MTATPIPPEPQSLADLHAQDALHLRGLLMEMADLGGALLRMIVQQADGEACATAADRRAPADCAVAYGHVTRSVRRTVLLVQKLTEPTPPAKDVPPAPDRAAARKQIIRKVEDAIHREAPEDDADALRAELLERLEGPEFDDDLEQRPVAEIVGEICADLGIQGAHSLAFWKRRTPADIAVLCANAHAPHPARDPRSVDLAELAAALLHDTPRIRGP